MTNAKKTALLALMEYASPILDERTVGKTYIAKEAHGHLYQRATYKQIWVKYNWITDCVIDDHDEGIDFTFTVTQQLVDDIAFFQL
ncbi:MAG: hypothetical protein KJO69_01920 [Gammaproteobacteria bacterium]|nr:hypothetical protein [Gammaproteobacteria bacterium]